MQTRCNPPDLEMAPHSMSPPLWFVSFIFNGFCSLLVQIETYPSFPLRFQHFSSVNITLAQSEGDQVTWETAYSLLFSLWISESTFLGLMRLWWNPSFFRTRRMVLALTWNSSVFASFLADSLGFRLIFWQIWTHWHRVIVGGHPWLFFFFELSSRARYMVAMWRSNFAARSLQVAPSLLNSQILERRYEETAIPFIYEEYFSNKNHCLFSILVFFAELWSSQNLTKSEK